MAYHRYIFTEPEKKPYPTNDWTSGFSISANPAMTGTGRASFIPMLSPNFFMSFTEPVFFRQKMIRSRLQRTIWY